MGLSLIIQTSNKFDAREGQDVYAPKRGDVIDYFDENWVFGESETSNPDWLIIRVPDLTEADGELLISPELDILGEVVVRYRGHALAAVGEPTRANVLAALTLKPVFEGVRFRQEFPPRHNGAFDYSSRKMEYAGRFSAKPAEIVDSGPKTTRLYATRKIGAGDGANEDTGFVDNPFRPTIHGLLSERRVRAKYFDKVNAFVLEITGVQSLHDFLSLQDGVLQFAEGTTLREALDQI